jgi:hypothetical protein
VAVAQDFKGAPHDAETRAIHTAMTIANRPRHIPILDIRSTRVIAPVESVKITRRGQTVSRSTVQIDAAIRSLDARIATRKARWEREDSDARLSKDYFISRDKYGNETHIAWSIMRAERPDLYGKRQPAHVIRVDMAGNAVQVPHGTYAAPDMSSQYWSIMLGELQTLPMSHYFPPAMIVERESNASPSAIDPRKVTLATPRQREARRKYFEHKQILANRDVSIIPPSVPAPQISGLVEHTFYRVADDTVHTYRGIHEPTDEMKAFDPKTMEAKLTRDVLDESESLGVPRIQNYKTMRATA